MSNNHPKILVIPYAYGDGDAMGYRKSIAKRLLHTYNKCTLPINIRDGTHTYYEYEVNFQYGFSVPVTFLLKHAFRQHKLRFSLQAQTGTEWLL